MDMTPYIKAKSDQLNADDLIGGPVIIKIVDVKETGSIEQPVSIYFEGAENPYKPSKTFRRVLVGMWGKSAKGYLGRHLELYRDPEIKHMGIKTGGIAISKATDLPGKKVFEIMLPVSRGKKNLYRILPLKVDGDTPVVEIMTDAQFAEKLPAVRQHVEAGKISPEQAVARLEKTARLTVEQKKQVLDLGAAETGGVDFE